MTVFPQGDSSPRGYYTAARRYDFLSSSGENNILRTSAASA
jgi:hypothetical protein